MTLHCVVDQAHKVHRIRRTWNLDDIAGAVAACREQFGFPPKQ